MKNQTVILRIRVVKVIFFLLFFTIIGRLFYWQVLASEKLAFLAKNQYHWQKEIAPVRGEIFAKDRLPLATNKTGYLLYASLADIKIEAKKIAEKLAPLLVSEEDIESTISAQKEKEKLIEEKEESIKDNLELEKMEWVALAHKIDKQNKERIDALNIDGLGFEPEPLRFYPEASMAAHLLGFVGKNEQGKNTGYFGLEGFYDIELKGRKGLLTQQIDALRLPILIGSFNAMEEKDGQDLILNIDRAVQFIVEEKLKEAVERHEAKSGEVVIMDPKSGDIIAMSSYPGFNPNKYYKNKDDVFKNPLISDTYEPGSTFKIMVMASALDMDAVEKDTKCDICTGPLKIDKYEIKTWNDKYWPDSNMTDVIVHSDNVGMVFVSRKMEKADFLEYLQKFGFGEKTGIDLQGEVPSYLKPEKQWTFVDMATASFGQGLAVTGIQMVRATGVIANGGRLVEPHVVDKMVAGNEEIEVKENVVRRVVSEETANIVKDMMVKAVDEGESKYLRIPGYKIAGKTGTAQIPVAGHYDKEKTIASFVGFAPAETPRFVMLTKIREPKSSPWGSETAAPLFFDIAEELLLYYGIQPE